MVKSKKQQKQKARWEPRIPNALYTTGFDDIATRWHKNPKAPDALLDQIKIEMAIEGLRVAEGLIISPSVCSHVYGENVVLPRLIDAFGVTEVEQLLEEGALEFLLWRPFILFMPMTQRGRRMEGIDPLTPGNANNPEHSDPQASVESGLKWSQVPSSKLQRIVKLAIERTHLPAENVSHDAVRVVRTAYDRGALRRYGFDPNVPRHELEDDRRHALSLLADGIAKGSVLYELGYDLHESDWTWKQLLRIGDMVGAYGAINAVEEGLRLENIPNIPMLIRKGVFSMQDVVKLRHEPATQELRKWLWEQPDPHNAEAVARAWLAAIQNKPLKDRTWFKGVRLTAFSILGGIAGALTGSPQGLLAGAAAGTALNQALGAVDMVGVESLLSKPSPRHFADLLRQKMAVRAAPAQLPEGNRKQRRATKAKQRKAK